MSLPYILIIEDNKIVRDALVWLLEKDDIEILTAENGAQGLKQLNTQSQLPRAIVLDLLMPQLDGFEFRKIQQQNPHWATIPTIINSAQVDSNAFQLFPNEILLNKPFSAEKFYDAVRTIINKQNFH